MRNKIVVIIASVCILFLGIVGCSKSDHVKVHSRRAVAPLMDSAEIIMNDDPEYALLLLDSIDSRSIHRRALNARYALLYSEVNYKCYNTADNDSLIMIAVRYYSLGNHPELLFRSFYSLGCIYNESGRYIDAAVALEQAEQLTDKIDDGYRLGLLYTELGNAFFYSYDFQRAEQYYRLAYDCFCRAKKESHSYYALLNIGGCLLQLQHFEEAHSLFEKVQRWAESNNDNSLISSCLLNSLYCSLGVDDMETADNEANHYKEIFGVPHRSSKSISKFAQYHIKKNDLKTAREMLDEAWAHANPADSVNMLYVESLYQEKIGRSDYAIELYKESIDKQNNNLRSILNQPIIGAQKEYYKSLSEVESIRASRSRNAALFLFIILVLLVVIMKFVSYNRALKTESEKQGLLLTIKELRLKEDSSNEIINKLNNRVNALFVKQYAELDEVFDKMIELDNAFSDDQGNANLDERQLNKRYYKKLELFHNRIRDRFNDIKSVKNQKALDKIINDIYGNLMFRLSDKKLKLSSNDLLILRLLICGFSPKVVSSLVQEQPKIIYQKRNRIIKKIGQTSVDLAQELCKVLRIS